MIKIGGQGKRERILKTQNEGLGQIRAILELLDAHASNLYVNFPVLFIIA